MWTLLLGFALAAIEPAGHPGVADPVAFMRARYGEYLSGDVRALALDTYPARGCARVSTPMTRPRAGRR